MSTATASAVQPNRRARILDWSGFAPVALGVIFCASVVTYVLIGQAHLVPDLFPDEIFYGKLSQSFAAGDGLQLHGGGTGLPPAWPVLLSSVWHFGSVPHGYDIARVMTAVLISTVVFPTWLLARTFVGPRLALVPAALSVTGAWMFVASFLISENLAYPLATASLGCTVMAMRDLRVRWLCASVAFALIATATRTQMLVLVPILVLALALDVLRQPKGARRARLDARPRVLWIALVVGAVALCAAFVLKPSLTHYDVLSHHASIGDVAGTTGRHAASAVLMFALVPVAAVFALMLRAENWRSDLTGPLLVTIAAATVVLFPVLGRFEAWATDGFPVDRYGMYLAPLFATALVTAPGRIDRRFAVLAAFAVAAAMFAVPVARDFVEQPAVFGIEERLFHLPKLFHHLPIALVLTSLPVTLAGMWALSTTARPHLGLAIASTLTAAIMVAANWTVQNFEINVQRGLAPRYITEPYDWVDRHADGPVALFAVAKPEPFSGNPDVYTEFFNRKIKYLFTTDSTGVNSCQVGLAARGMLESKSSGCPAWPRNILVVERSSHLTFYGERRLASRGPSGTLLQVPAGTPRVMSVVDPPCLPTACQGRLDLLTYLDAPGQLAIRFGPSGAEHRVQTGPAVRVLPAGKANTLRLPVSAGDGRLSLPVDWNTPDGPPLESIYLTSSGQTSRIF